MELLSSLVCDKLSIAPPRECVMEPITAGDIKYITEALSPFKGTKETERNGTERKETRCATQRNAKPNIGRFPFGKKLRFARLGLRLLLYPNSLNRTYRPFAFILL